MIKKTISFVAASFLATTIQANDNLLDLGAIYVTSATKTEQTIKDITSNVTVITNAEIEEKHYTTVAQALNSIAGISYTSNGGIGSNTSINLRGAGNNRTLVLIDGIRYQDPSNTSGANIQHLIISDIERIEVIKGAQSGIWGADASAGVINIITKKAKKGTSGSINVETGSFNTKKYGASISHKTKEFDIKFSADKITSDGFTVQAPRDEDIDKYEDDAYTNTTLNLQANYNINDDSKLKVNITDIDALKEYDSYGNPDDTTMKSDVSNKLYDISYLQTFNNHNFKIKVEQSKFSRDEIGTVAQWGSEYVKVFNGEYNNIEINDNIKYNKKDFLLLGVGTSYDDVDYIMTDNTTKQKENKDNYIYATNSNTFDKTILTQSIRYDDYNNFDNKATGKLGIKYYIKKDTFVSSNIGTAYNVPNIVQELNPWGATNDELNPENSKSADISVGYKALQFTYFYNKVTDLIQWYDPDGWGGDPAIYKNLTGESIFKGIELDYKTEVNEETLLSVNYTLLSAKDKDGKVLARRASQILKFGIDYYGIDRLHLGLNGEYVGERYDRDDKQGEQTGRYTLANFVVNYDITRTIKVYGKIDNIINKYYQTIDGYATSPRAYYAGMKISF